MPLYPEYKHPASEYPKRKYAPMGGSVTVHAKHEEDALGAGWTDNAPAETESEEGAKPPKAAKTKPVRE
jgi:hypothetical protein